jgi:hypothetical protein
MDRFNAWNLARSWASVALAQGEDDGRPVLYRTTLIESFDSGIRLLSTDTFVLLKAWVPNIRHEDAPEPLVEELPREVAICRDLDHRVLGLMKYIQKITKDDGGDTRLTVEFAVGEPDEESARNTLEGLAASTVHFRIVEKYDESIETPIFEGAYPNWRDLWANHVWSPAQSIGFGANGILRLGNLSKLWDKAVIHFELGGSVGVSKIRIDAGSDVNVTGLVMPTKTAETGGEMPASEEARVDGDLREFSESFDEWYADLLRTEEASTGVDDLVEAAVESQLRRAAEFVVEAGYATAPMIAATLDVEPERAAEIIESLREDGIIGEPGQDDGRHEILRTDLTGYREESEVVHDSDDDPLTPGEQGVVITDEDIADARALVIDAQLGSTAMLQRKMRIGFSKATVLMAGLEAAGVVGPAPADGKAREVLVASEDDDT